MNITISTFPHQVELNRMRRRIASHRDVHSFFRAVGDIVENFDDLRARYTQYQDFWFQLKTCIENDIRDRIHLFSEIFQPDHTLPILQNGFLSGLDANAANFLSVSFRENRRQFTLRNTHMTQCLLDNPFYIHASDNLKKEIADFLYCTIVFPKPGGLIISFQRPHVSHLPEGFHPGHQVVLFDDEYEDNFPHVVPIVPFVHYGGSYRVLDATEYHMALPFLMPESDTIPRIPLATDDHITSALHDHDALFRLTMTPLPERDGDLNNQTENLIQRIYEILCQGQERITVSDAFRGFVARRPRH